MKTIRLFGTRGLTLILGAALGVSVGFASPVFAAQHYGADVIVNPDGKVTYLPKNRTLHPVQLPDLG